jgi:death-on-curing protein
MTELSAEEIIKIHEKIVKRFNITDGVINRSNLESVVERPNTVINNKEMYPDVYSKAASLLEGIIRWHPFADGNKRTALLTMIYFLKLEGYGMALPLSAIRYSVKIAKNRQIDEGNTKKLIRDISIWIDRHSGKTQKELTGKVIIYLVIPYKFLMFLSKIKLEHFSRRVVGKWMAFDLYPEYEKQAGDIVKFIQETLEASLKVFDHEEAK